GSISMALDTRHGPGLSALNGPRPARHGAGPSPAPHAQRAERSTHREAGSGEVGGRRGDWDWAVGAEALRPPVYIHVINLDAALGDQLLDVPVRQREPQVSAKSQNDHLLGNRKPANSETGTGG